MHGGLLELIRNPPGHQWGSSAVRVHGGMPGMQRAKGASTLPAIESRR